MALGGGGGGGGVLGEVGVGKCWIFDVVGDVCLSGVFWDSTVFFSSGSIS